MPRMPGPARTRASRRSFAIFALVFALLVPPATASAGGAPAPAAVATARPSWMTRIDALVGGRRVGVAIGVDGTLLYQHHGWFQQAPASNEKLLLSMALLAHIPATAVLRTRVMAARRIRDGVVDGPLWLVGDGDPETDTGDMAAMAGSLVDAGLRRVRGRILGATVPFIRDWSAPGWEDDFPKDEVARPTALTFDGNVGPRGVHIHDPERRAAGALTRALVRRGVHVNGKPGLGRPSGRLLVLARHDSDPFAYLVHRMNLDSVNFAAEVLGKLLALRMGRAPTIAGGAASIAAFAALHGVHVTTHDSSGLSHTNRASAEDLLQMLWVADARPWGPALKETLPRGGEGTLKGRLTGVRVRAKTGTLWHVSALSGWLWLTTSHSWAEFSILSHGMTKSESVQIENRIVQIVSANAEAP